MKTKKFLSALLALVMLLSILPMAAFAAEEEHTHDETCGCVEPASICYHLAKRKIGTSYTYTSEGASVHLVEVSDRYFCPGCNLTMLIKSDTYRESHSWVRGTYTGRQYEEQGEIYYIYNVACSKCAEEAELAYLVYP